MSGLNSLLSDSITKATTLPSWYDTAQQQAVASGVNNVGSMPTLANTVAGTAINTLNGPNNPFTQAQGTLNTIGQGAANPWITNPTTGAVTPNTNTAMGGLFSAQNDQLKQLLPSYEAPATAGAVAGGNFGSLRGDTAANTALTNAQANLFANQMQSALQNQQTGVSAGNALGAVGSEGVASESTLGKMQQGDPMAQPMALATLLGSIKAPESVNTEGQLSPLSQLQTILGAVGGTNLSGILGSIFGTGTGGTTGTPTTGTPSITDILGNIFGGASTNPGGSTIPGMPTDTSGATPGTFPDILGGNTTGNTDTGVYSPIDTTISPDYNAPYNQP